MGVGTVNACWVPKSVPRKVSSDGASLTAGGRLFQARAAATGLVIIVRQYV